jgi:hypothetical protein
MTRLKLISTIAVSTCAALGAFAQTPHDVTKLVCNFGPHIAQGKSMAATCSGQPEKTFSTIYNQHSAKEHCNTTEIREVSAYRNFVVNLQLSIATWNHEFIADPSTQDEIIMGSMERNDLSEEDARARFEESMNTGELGKITAVQKTFDTVMVDPITDEFIEPPRKEPALTLLLTDTMDRNYAMHISSNNDAILTEFTRISDHSWISAKFGKCRFE